MSGVKNKALIATAPVVLACVVFAPHRVTGSHSKATTQEAPGSAAGVRLAAVPSDSGDADVPGAELPDAVDLYGNEVTDAVAKYQYDAAGSLYELHSPDTEVPKRKPPKT